MKIFNKLLILLFIALSLKASDFKDCFNVEAWQIDEKVNAWLEQNKSDLLKLSILGQDYDQRKDLLERIQNNDFGLYNKLDLSLHELVKIPFKSNSKITCTVKTEGKIFFGRENGKICLFDILSNSFIEEDEEAIEIQKKSNRSSAFSHVIRKNVERESGVRALSIEPNGFYGYSYHENGDVKEIKIIDGKIIKKKILNLTKKLNGHLVKNIFQVKNYLFLVTKASLFRYDFNLNEFVDFKFSLNENSDFLDFYFDSLTMTHNVASYNKSNYQVEVFTYDFECKSKKSMSFDLHQTDVINFVKFYRKIDSFEILIKIKNKLDASHKIIFGDLLLGDLHKIEFEDNAIKKEKTNYLSDQVIDDIINDISLIDETIFMSDKNGILYTLIFSGEEFLITSDDEYNYGSISQVIPLTQDVTFIVLRGEVYLRNLAHETFNLHLKVNKYLYLQMLVQELEKQRAVVAQVSAVPGARVLFKNSNNS